MVCRKRGRREKKGNQEESIVYNNNKKRQTQEIKEEEGLNTTKEKTERDQLRARERANAWPTKRSEIFHFNKSNGFIG
jgi:hypothetical protein